MRKIDTNSGMAALWLARVWLCLDAPTGGGVTAEFGVAQARYTPRRALRSAGFPWGWRAPARRQGLACGSGRVRTPTGLVSASGLFGFMDAGLVWPLIWRSAGALHPQEDIAQRGFSLGWRAPARRRGLVWLQTLRSAGALHPQGCEFGILVGGDGYF